MSTEATSATDIKLISANGLRAVLADVAPAFERATGHKLAVTVTETGEIRERILAGARYDVIALPQTTADELASRGHIDPGSMVPVIRVGFGLAVRAGVPKPDTSSAGAVRRALIAAQSILITDPATGGISGVHFMSVLEQLGMSRRSSPSSCSIAVAATTPSASPRARPIWRCRPSMRSAACRAWSSCPTRPNSSA
jgi:molybdate transport system substrate-binding protein